MTDKRTDPILIIFFDIINILSLLIFFPSWCENLFFICQLNMISCFQFCKNVFLFLSYVNPTCFHIFSYFICELPFFFLFFFPSILYLHVIYKFHYNPWIFLCCFRPLFVILFLGVVLCYFMLSTQFQCNYFFLH